MPYDYQPSEPQIDFIYDLIQHRQDRNGVVDEAAEVVMARSTQMFDNYLDLVISLHHVFRTAQGLTEEERNNDYQVLDYWLHCFSKQASTNSPDTIEHLIKMDRLIHEARTSGSAGWFFDKMDLQDRFNTYDRLYLNAHEVTHPDLQFKIFDEQGHPTGDLTFIVSTVPSRIMHNELHAMAVNNESGAARAFDHLYRNAPDASYSMTSTVAAKCVESFKSTKSPLYNAVVLRKYRWPGQYLGGCLEIAFGKASSEKLPYESADDAGSLARLMFENPAYVKTGLPEDLFRLLMSKKGTDDYKNPRLLIPMIQQAVQMEMPLLKLASACIANSWAGFDVDEQYQSEAAIQILEAAHNAQSLSQPKRQALLGLWYIKTASEKELRAHPLTDKLRVFLYEMTRSSGFLQDIKDTKMRDRVIGADLGL
ncbi:hypothetical protein IFT48_02705 [Pseudomonas fluorescens]|uniref:hypothetical protein n=1 Tax=Pseudomonas fluorescens TaxID=294 RepID=UPI001930C6B1|nr:hypothetical protein [Pseudomonas fluorescens]MBD8088876.1 hypothetical protein [Pseudomonas fluorescens]